MEYDNTQNNASHIHAVWRDLQNDFGEDLLRKHYEQTPSKVSSAACSRLCVFATPGRPIGIKACKPALRTAFPNTANFLLRLHCAQYFVVALLFQDETNSCIPIIIGLTAALCLAEEAFAQPQAQPQS